MKTAASKAELFALVRKLHPTAPRIGRKVVVYVGERVHEDGRSVHTVVRGADDLPRASVVLGYEVRQVTDRRRPGVLVDVLIRVRLVVRSELGHRERLVHVSCLACIPSEIGVTP